MRAFACGTYLLRWVLYVEHCLRRLQQIRTFRTCRPSSSSLRIFVTSAHYSELFFRCSTRSFASDCTFPQLNNSSRSCDIQPPGRGGTATWRIWGYCPYSHLVFLPGALSPFAKTSSSVMLSLRCGSEWITGCEVAYLIDAGVPNPKIWCGEKTIVCTVHCFGLEFHIPQ